MKIEFKSSFYWERNKYEEKRMKEKKKHKSEKRFTCKRFRTPQESILDATFTIMENK